MLNAEIDPFNSVRDSVNNQIEKLKVKHVKFHDLVRSTDTSVSIEFKDIRRALVKDVRAVEKDLKVLRGSVEMVEKAPNKFAHVKVPELAVRRKFVDDFQITINEIKTAIESPEVRRKMDEDERKNKQVNDNVAFIALSNGEDRRNSDITAENDHFIKNQKLQTKQIIAEQDKNLGMLEIGVTRLEEVGRNIHTELKDQEVLLTKLGDEVDTASDKMNTVLGLLQKLLKTKDGCQIWTIVILGVVLILLGQPNAIVRNAGRIQENLQKFIDFHEDKEKSIGNNAACDQMRHLFAALNDAQLPIYLELSIATTIKILLRKGSNRSNLDKFSMRCIVTCLNRLQKEKKLEVISEMCNIVLNACYDGLNIQLIIDQEGISPLIRLLNLKIIQDNSPESNRVISSVLGALQGVCYIPAGRHAIRQDNEIISKLLLYLAHTDSTIKARAIGTLHNLSVDLVSIVAIVNTPVGSNSNSDITSSSGRRQDNSSRHNYSMTTNENKSGSDFSGGNNYPIINNSNINSTGATYSAPASRSSPYDESFQMDNDNNASINSSFGKNMESFGPNKSDFYNQDNRKSTFNERNSIFGSNYVSSTSESHSGRVANLLNKANGNSGDNYNENNSGRYCDNSKSGRYNGAGNNGGDGGNSSSGGMNKAVELIVRLLRDQDIETCQAAAGTLQNLSRDNGARKEIMRSNAVTYLTDMLFSSDVDCQVSAIGTILNIVGPSCKNEHEKAVLLETLTNGLVLGSIRACVFGDNCD